MRGCFMALFFLVPPLAGGIGIAMAQSERQTIARMVPVEAEILSTGVRERLGRYLDRGREVFHIPHPRFAYYVDGERHTSNLYALRSSEYVLRASAERRLAPYARGETATAFYDPENPEVAVLNRGVSALPYLGILIGAGGGGGGPPPPPWPGPASRRRGRRLRRAAKAAITGWNPQQRWKPSGAATCCASAFGRP